MCDALQRIRLAPIRPAVATITVDAYTRVGNIEAAAAALAQGEELNGYPIACHSSEVTRSMLEQGLRNEIPVQVRHGCANPGQIFRAAAAAGVYAIEGGPVSYNFPYSRAPLKQSVADWGRELISYGKQGRDLGYHPHVETFGGCMLGQLCPASLLSALTVLEGLFCLDHGIGSISLSHIQGSNDDQDVGALIALRRLAERYFANIDWHIVHYTWMGLFPKTAAGAEAIIRASSRIAKHGGAERIIVKTVAEAARIPTIDENIQALTWARETADATEPSPTPCALAWADEIACEAQQLISATTELKPCIADALVTAFSKGILDVPFCTHISNRNVTRPSIDRDTGEIRWTNIGRLPISKPDVQIGNRNREPTTKLRELLVYNQRKYDSLAASLQEPS
jgi:methylaspartate mutase epsilon subunit